MILPVETGRGHLIIQKFSKVTNILMNAMKNVISIELRFLVE